MGYLLRVNLVVESEHQQTTIFNHLNIHWVFRTVATNQRCSSLLPFVGGRKREKNKIKITESEEERKRERKIVRK